MAVNETYFNEMWDLTKVVPVTISKGYKDEWVVRMGQGFSLTDDIVKWCYEILGEPGHDRKYRWRMKWADRDRIFLRNKDDVLMFTLRWC